MQHVGACRGMGMVHQLHFSARPKSRLLSTSALIHQLLPRLPCFLKAAGDILGFIEALKVHLGNFFIRVEDVTGSFMIWETSLVSNMQCLLQPKNQLQ